MNELASVMDTLGAGMDALGVGMNTPGAGMDALCDSTGQVLIRRM